MKTIVVKTQAELDALFRILSRCEKSNGSGCWIYTGSVDSCGYGKIYYKGRPRSTHVVIYELFHGKSKCDVCHECDNIACCNPMHLKDRTRKRNMRDAVKRGLIKTGINHPLSAINRKKLSIAEHYKSLGFSNAEIGKKIGVHGETVRRYLSKGSYGNKQFAEFFGETK